MDKTTKILINIPNELNYKLNVHLAKLRSMGVKTTKEKLILKLTQVGYISEDKVTASGG